MNEWLKRMGDSPLWVRVAPFALFLGLTSCQGQLGEASRYWLYLVKTAVAIPLIWWMWPRVKEMRWVCNWLALAAGVLVFLLWVGLNDLYPKLFKASAPWNPHTAFGHGSLLAWVFIGVRIVGSALVVPPLEEVFYRSFLYRYLAKPDFAAVPLGAFAWLPFLATAAIFGLAHYEWLAGILCGLVYQGLVCRTKRLGEAMTAHAVTNLLLGLWVATRGDWRFW